MTDEHADVLRDEDAANTASPTPSAAVPRKRRPRGGYAAGGEFADKLAVPPAAFSAPADQSADRIQPHPTDLADPAAESSALDAE